MNAQTIEAVTKLVNTLGVGPFFGFLGVVLAAGVGIHIWRARRADAAFAMVIAAKTETIDRIAEQNRDLRFQLMVLRGTPEEKAFLLVYERVLGAKPDQPQLEADPVDKKKQRGKGSK